MIFRSRLATAPGLLARVYRSAAGLWLPDWDAVLDRRDNCFAVLTRADGSRLLVPGQNIVTDAGDIHTAQSAAGETPTDAFGVWEQCSAGTPGKAADRSDFTPIASSELAHDATYPKTNDGDADNPGADVYVVTRRASYGAASFGHAAITHAIITNATPGASEPLLTGFAWASAFPKTTSDTLKVFHNLGTVGV